MKKYRDEIEKNDQEYYSLNFLMAELEEIENLKRDLKIIEKRSSCKVFETKDFKPRFYYKHISSCIVNFENND